VKGRPNFVTACLLFSKRVKPEQPPKVGGGGGKPTKSKRPKRSKAPRPEAETITPYAKARRTLENTLSAIEKMVNLNLQDEHLLRPPTGIKTLQIEALLYLQKYQDPKDVKPQELVEIKNQELEELIQHIKTQIDEIKIALEEERAGETNRINDTLKVIVNGLITRLEGLRSDHLVELISFLRQEYL
jgi:hypothetical protein